MILIRLISKLPFRALYAISDFLFFITYYLLGYRGNIVKKNLRNSFPERHNKELQKIQKQFYKNLADYGVETLKLLTIPEQELRKRMVYKNPEVVKEFTSQGQSVLLLSSHQFNWEWLLAAGCFSLPMQIDFVYQTQGSDFFNRFSLLIRSRFGGYGISRQQVAREVIKRKDILRGIAIVADQFPGHENDKRYWTTFLNQRTAFFQSINQLAILTQYPAFYASVKKIKRGYYEVELIKIAEPPYDKNSFHIVDQYARATEQLINKCPDGWLWSHNRWKERD
jgi:Kdo2-lipid IVA lauroyltransferase/acyltransferase